MAAVQFNDIEIPESPKRLYYHAEDLGELSQSSDEPTSERRWPVGSEDDANLISSEVDGSDLHMPTLDIDFPVSIRESETPGHFHLFIDKPMSWEKYGYLLEALADAGILEEGYVNASLDRGATFVATRPWKTPEARWARHPNRPRFGQVPGDRDPAWDEEPF